MTLKDATLAAAARRAGSVDPLSTFDETARGTFTTIAGHLIPAAHGMPSAGDVIGDERLRFVLNARPDLVEPLLAALRPDLGDDPSTRLARLERDEPANLAALLLTVVGGYYTDPGVRDRLGYPGQLEVPLERWEPADYKAEGLVADVLARGPIWRDPETGVRAIRDR